MFPKKNLWKEGMAWFSKDQVILNQVKKDKNTIYGAQSIKKQIGFLARPTQDYDILSRKPRQSAAKLERNLDKQAGGDYYYVKPAMHPGTYKVKHKGMDFRKETDDDLEVADFTKPTRSVKTVNIEGIRYSRLSESVKDKKKSLRDPQYSFRHEKDRDDLERIKLAKKMGVKYRCKKNGQTIRKGKWFFRNLKRKR